MQKTVVIPTAQQPQAISAAQDVAQDVLQTSKDTEGKKTKQNDKDKMSLFDTAISKIVSANEINDNVQVPRPIFKGYLAFFLGTSTAALAGITKKIKFLSTPLNIASIALCAIGTFEFVKPFLLKNDKTNVENKQ